MTVDHYGSHRTRQADRRLAQMEQRYFGLLEAAPDAMAVVDQDGLIVLLNLRAESQFGYPRDELLGHPVTTIIPNGFAERLVADSLRTAAEALSQQIGTGIELIGRRRDGTEFPIEIMLSPLETPEGLLVTAAIRDISLRRLAENKIIYLNRIYATLSGINTLIVRARNRDELFREACRLAVEAGGFCKVWIGLVDATGKNLDLTASADMDPNLTGILDDSCVLAECGPLGSSLAVRAVREKKVLFSNSVQADTPLLFGGEYAATEIHSTAVLPLIVADSVVGVFALYSTETDFFDEVELNLLAELAGDISYAIANIDQQDQLSYLAYYDALTGLANQKLFLERVSTQILSASYGGHELALYLFDLEGFKNINDSLGQTAGDTLLQQVAEWLTGQVGDPNLVARISSDCFAVVLPMVGNAGDVARLVKKSMAEFTESLFHLHDVDLRVAAKVGVALFPEDADTADQLFKKAEAALKRAKEDGDRYLFYTRKMTDMVASRLSLENQLRKALEEEQFVLHYQPIIDLSSGEISGAEALIRWNHPEAGLLAPVDFIPILEETGMIRDVGRWVLRQAIDDYLRWCDQGLPNMRVAVNLSQLQLRDPEFVTEIRELLAVDARAATGLELEITESLMMLDVEQNVESLNAIRELGVRIAIDDFGTGYSSLSHLARLPVDTLKVDRTFVQDMTLSPEGHVLVHAIISLAHLLKINVVAEGVETEGQSEALRLLSCNEVQGFLFSKPIPADVFEEGLLAAGKSLAEDGLDPVENTVPTSACS
ncbi:EAL domain-containing protein [Haliea sp. E1-2-M8]|uniref:sensor domain-containing protein n=1 Tax=Haliea sp. E1-2-M8 TaxID=3064706 RepID=UPI00271AC76C|nr:EAL domain-containing protein [Haliea sp. E1-2-M8]MDO8860803.1 EAL domain-containing protein [Haliea sp. E1-2-M8]